MLNRTLVSAMARAALAGVVLACPALAGAQVAPATIQAAFQRIEPAICMLTYTAEVTNPQTYETARRDIRSVGLIVSSTGLVLAHGHMSFAYSEPLNIKAEVMRNGEVETFPATLLQKPSDVNVVFLQIEAEGERFAYASMAAVPLRLGDPVAVCGIMGETLDYVRGVVHRRVGAVLDEPRTAYILDENVPFGFVGGPVIDSQGRIAGVAGFDLSQAQGGDPDSRSGHPLVFPAALLAPHIASPPGETDPASEDAYLGILTQPLTDDLAEYWGLPKRGGVVVSTIVPGSPAARAGLQRGDVIVAFNGRPVAAKRDRDVITFTNMVKEAGVGAEVPVGILRGGDPVDLSLTLEKRPVAAQEADVFEDTVFGLTVRELTRDVRLMLNLPEDVEGVIVLRVRSGSWAELAGMGRGVIILRFGEYPVTSVAEFQEAVEQTAAAQPGEVPVFGRVGPRTGFFRLQPKW